MAFLAHVALQQECGAIARSSEVEQLSKRVDMSASEAWHAHVSAPVSNHAGPLLNQVHVSLPEWPAECQWSRAIAGSCELRQAQGWLASASTDLGNAHVSTWALTDAKGPLPDTHQLLI